MQVNNRHARIKRSSAIFRLVALLWSRRLKTSLEDTWHARAVARISHYAEVRAKAPNKILRKYGK